MDLPPTTVTTSTTTAPRIRLMCSYGGHIIPRPQTKSLYYAGGENRLITIPTAGPSLTLSSFTAHLSSFLRLANPFVLKYQLPNHDLDSLISISTDDDLQIMLEEQSRLSSSATSSSRIRLFLFPAVDKVNVELSHPKRESWFVDALRSARVGFGGEISSEQESIVLETSSSFGSTSSSLSLSNLPPIRHSSGSILSDDCVGNAVSTVQTETSQDQVTLFAAMETRVFSNQSESDNKVADYSSGIDMYKPLHASGFPINIMDLPQQQKQLVHEGTHFIQQNMPGVQHVTSYYPVYHTVPQEQHLHYQSNQPYPVYYLPVVSTQSYNIPVQCGMVPASSIVSVPPQTHQNASLIPPQRVPKEVAMLPQPAAELNSQTYKNIPGHPLVHVPYNETETKLAGAQIQHQPLAFGPTAGETANYANKLDDDLARIQIYKSQPPPPSLPSQYQTVTKASTLLLSEALAHMDNANQQSRTSEPK